MKKIFWCDENLITFSTRLNTLFFLCKDELYLIYITQVQDAKRFGYFKIWNGYKGSAI